MNSQPPRTDSLRDSPLVVRDTATLQTAMLSIDMNTHRTVIVVNDRNVVVGTLSDGDIRKALLDGRLFTTPVHRVMNPDFISLTAKERDRAKAIFDEHHIFLIPVIDEGGVLLEILAAY